MGIRIDVSIVIPAYNEARRLPGFLDEMIFYCKNSSRTYEVIVVDDGSNDKTFEIASGYKTRFPELQAAKIKKNSGKGYAVEQGFLRARGDICLFLDADGSVGPDEIGKNLHYVLEDGYDIFVGSRVIRDNSRILKVKWYRKAAGSVFNFLVQTFLFKDIKDTQCGFKMFRNKVVRPLFSKSHIRGFGFDMEIMYLAYKMGYKVKEGPVSWRHIGGSRFNLIVDSIKMLFNIFQIRKWHRDLQPLL